MGRGDSRAAADVLLYASVAALNLSLALLVGRVRPRPLAANLVLLLLVTTAGLVATGALTLMLPGNAGVLVWMAFAFDAAAFVPLLALPFVFPWRRVGPRSVRAVLWAGALLVAESALAVALLSPELFRSAADPAWLDLPFVPFALAYKVVPALGALLFLDSFLAARDRVPREQAGLFLGAFALKVGAISGLLAPGLLAPDFGVEGTDPGAAVRAGAGVLADAVALVAFAAIPLALAVARRPGGSRAGAPWHMEALVLGMLVLGVALTLANLTDAEYLVLRPAFLAYATLQYQLLDVEARKHRAAIGAAVVAAVGAMFILVVQAAEAAALAPSVAVGAGFFAALVVAGAFGWPMLQLALSSAGGDRRLLIYRAALEAASREGRGAEAFEALRPLRQELGVSDREHEQVLAGSPEPTQAGPLAPGNLFVGRYRIARELGRGASGEVYLARDERLGREVAVKRLGEAHRRDAAALARFRRETRLASALQHPNIVAVYDVETVGSDAYLVMEHVAGGTLDQRLRASGTLPEAEARAVALGILDALAALHARGILHRDVKPSNILLDEAGRAKLADFTVAREAVSSETVGLAARGPVGTYAYMAPEQARGAAALPASDLYALGATLYHALAGRPAIEVEGLGEMEARMRLLEAKPALPLPGVSRATNDALERSLAKEPALRFPDAAAMAKALGKSSLRAEDQQAPAHADDIAGA